MPAHNALDSGRQRRKDDRYPNGGRVAERAGDELRWQGIPFATYTVLGQYVMEHGYQRARLGTGALWWHTGRTSLEARGVVLEEESFTRGFRTMEQIIAKLLQEFERGKLSRRELILSLAAAAAASPIGTSPAAAAQPEGQVFKATAFNHVSYEVADYQKSRDFYAGLFGMTVTVDDGMQCRLAFGDNILIPRNRPSGTPRVDHIAYTIEGWDTDEAVRPALKAELERRGLEIRESATGGGSFLVMDPDGFLVQMGGEDQ